MSLAIPVLAWVFFVVAPYWLNHRLQKVFSERAGNNTWLSPAEQLKRAEIARHIDFRKICAGEFPDLAEMRGHLGEAGVCSHFQRLHWGLLSSNGLLGLLGLAAISIFLLNQKASRSPQSLLRCYRLGWKLAMAAAFVQVLVATPLLTFAAFEFTVLLADAYSIKLLAVIALGGLAAMWSCTKILSANVPLEFHEPMSREVTPAEGPALWSAVRNAAEKLHTEPPCHIIIGMQASFYVTELAVRHSAGKTSGKTLFLSYPLIQQIAEEEALAVIGHELGHFVGADTQLTREFYPLRLKARATMATLARVGPASWASGQFLLFFCLCFEKTEKAISRARELAADEAGARLTSKATFGRALIKLHVLSEALDRSIAAAIRNQAPAPLNVPLQSYVREKLFQDTGFWTRLFEKELPHPLDSHPALKVRLMALEQPADPVKAQIVSGEETETACSRWFAEGEDLFEGITQQAARAVGIAKERTAITGADYSTSEGKELLDRLFPERKWHCLPRKIWFMPAALGGILTIVIILLIAFKIYGGLAFAGAAAFAFLIYVQVLRARHRGAILTLTPAGIGHSGWKESILFKDVSMVSARKHYSTFLVIFHFKKSRPSPWRASMSPFPVKETGIAVSMFDGNPAEIAQEIFRYLQRRPLPGQDSNGSTQSIPESSNPPP